VVGGGEAAGEGRGEWLKKYKDKAKEYLGGDLRLVEASDDITTVRKQKSAGVNGQCESGRWCTENIDLTVICWIEGPSFAACRPERQDT
jgi:hypothetical protein